MSEKTALTYCAYCSAEFPTEQPDSLELIQSHIYVCPLHPMRKVEREKVDLEALIAKLRVWAVAGGRLCMDFHSFGVLTRESGERMIHEFDQLVRQADTSTADAETPLERWLEWQEDARVNA